ncbi:MAG: ABC transporter substrate-binding protein [Alphaproteobacteria bacterium]|nr:ABC transporter substrate-binding protein [Alphaproteobacteria bacterium]
MQRAVEPRLCAAVLVLAASLAHAEEAGVDNDSIMFGQSAAFSGPAQDLGIGVRRGIELAFAEANEAGGVLGRTLELVSLDDAYEPEAAIANTTELITQENVFALIGAVGTPTSRSAVPVAHAENVPYIAPFTGAAFLRDRQWSTVINLRASYYQETEKIVDFLTRSLDINRIGVFYQDDSFGQAGLRGVQIALERRGLEMVGTGVYPRNTTAVKTGLLDLRSANPDAVVLVGAYEPVASFITWAKQIGFEPHFMTISFVGSNALIEKLGPASNGIFVTQVVPPPGGDEGAVIIENGLLRTVGDESSATSPPIVGHYRQLLARLFPGTPPSYVSLEGYLAGRLVVSILESCGEPPDRVCFLETMNDDRVIDLGGFSIRFGNDNQGSDAVFLTVVDDQGRYRKVVETAGGADGGE